MTTAVHAAFDGPEPLRHALRALRSKGTLQADITIFATTPEIERQIVVGEGNREEPSLAHGATVGAAAGSLIGAALAAPAALMLPVAVPVFMLIGLAGAAAGAVGGSVAGAIFGTGHDLQLQQAAEQELAAGRIVVTVKTGSDHVAEAEVALVEAGGRLVRLDEPAEPA